MSGHDRDASDDRAFLLIEYQRLAGDLMRYYDSITSTERLALAGAAGVIAFLYTELPSFAAGQAAILSAMPFAIVSLAGLRCLTIYLVMQATSDYLRKVEDHLLASGDMGFQRVFEREATMQKWMIERTTGAFWALAVAVTASFWLLYTPPGGT